MATAGRGANPEGVALGIAGILEPTLKPPHLLAGSLAGDSPPKPVQELLRDFAAGRDSAEVTPELRVVMPQARRELVGSLLKGLQAWTFLGCERVASRQMSRLATPIEWIWYAKGPVRAGEQKGNVVFTVLYSAAWRAAGMDLYFY